MGRETAEKQNRPNLENSRETSLCEPPAQRIGYPARLLKGLEG